MTRRVRLLALVVLGLVATGRTLAGQNAGRDQLARRISVRFDRVELATVLTRLRTVYGVPLAFSVDGIPERRLVTVVATDEPVSQVLSRVLEGTGLRLVPLAGGALVIVKGPESVAAVPPPARSPAPELATGVRELDQIVVMGTPVSGAPEREQTNAVSVVRGDDLKPYRFSRTADLFRSALPGVVLWDQGPSGPPAEIAAVRGASSFTARGLKTYVDGVEIASPTLITLLDPRSIERIEVIRGPQGAALYGSDAINGVIQVVTRKGGLGESPKVQGAASVAAGPFDREQVSTLLRQDYAGTMSWGGSRASIAAGGRWGRVGTGQTVPNTKNWTANAGGQVALGSLLVSVAGRGGQFDFTEDAFEEVPIPGAATAQASQIDVATVGVTAVHQVTDWWVQTFVTGYDHAAGAIGAQRNYLLASRRPLGATHETADRTSFRYSSALTAKLGNAAAFTTTLGLEHARLERSRGSWDANLTTQYVSLYRDEIRNTGAFLQGKMLLGAFVLNAGARAERSSAFGDDYGTAWAPSVGLSWSRPFDDYVLRLRGGWGRGIRPPEPGMSRGLQSATVEQQANPSLAPESQAGYELGADLYAGASAYLRATWFDQRATDLIQSVMLNAPSESLRTFQFQNVGAIRNKGIELEAGARLGRIGLDAQFYTTSSRVERIARNYSGSLKPGDQLPEIPRSSGSLRASYLRRNFQAILGATYIGSWTGYDWTEIALAAAGQTTPRPSYRDYLIEYPGILKPYLSLSFDLASQLTTYFSVDNLTNAYRFEQHNGNPPAGRSVMIGVEVRP